MNNQKNTECVKVVIRCRPFSSQEMQDSRILAVEVSPSRGEIIVKNTKSDLTDGNKVFTFDMVYDFQSKQEQIYQDTSYPIVESVLDGYNGTIFAYGQTGTGKTFTMEGVPEPPQYRGITPRAIEHIFRHIEGTPNKQFLVRASYLEIYNEEICDLLSKNYKKKLELRENPDYGAYVKDLTNLIIQNADEMKEKIIQGRKNRHVGETKMNKDSSRSHSIFAINLETIEMGLDGKQHIRAGKLNLVDLAGSERQSKTQAVGDRFIEAVNINLSLSALGNVISALVDSKATHIPYRDSKLTRLLQNSLGGNAKTVMVANIGPADYNYEETLSTLRYANHAKSIKNKPKINEDPKDTMIREYQEEINRLKDELSKRIGGTSISPDGTVRSTKVIEVETVVKVLDEEKLKEAEEKINREKAQILQQIEAERRKIENAINVDEEEKKRLLHENELREKRLNDYNSEQKNLIHKIKQMEEKLLQGDELKEKAKIQEQNLIHAKLELEKRNIEKRNRERDLMEKEEELNSREKAYKDVKEEIEIKTSKIATLVDKLNEGKQQKNEIIAYRAREKEILLEENRNLVREMKLYELIIDSFIPEEEFKKLEERLFFDEEIDDWQIKDKNDESLKRIEFPVSALDYKRPMCKFSRMAVNFGELNPRYKYDNVLRLDLDLPERTTEEFDGALSAKVQETITITLNEDEDDLNLLQSEGRPNIYIAKNPENDILLSPKITKTKSGVKPVVARLQSGIKKKNL